MCFYSRDDLTWLCSQIQLCQMAAHSAISLMVGECFYYKNLMTDVLYLRFIGLYGDSKGLGSPGEVGSYELGPSQTFTPPCT